MLCLFFITIGTTFASDVSDNENTNFKNEYTNTEDIGLSNELFNESTGSDNINTISDSDNSIGTNTSNNTSNSVNSSTGSINSSNPTNPSTSVNSSNSTNPSTSVNSTNSSSNSSTTVNSNNDSKNTSSNKNLAAAGEVKPTKLTQKQILAASNTVYKYVLKNKKLPNYVTIAGYKFSMPEFMYLLSKTITYKYKKISSSVTVKYNVKNPTKPTGSTIKAKMSSKYYYKYANNIVQYISKYNKVPNYALTSWGKMQYQTAIFGFSKLLSWSYLHNSKLPSSLTIKVAKSNKMNKYIPKYAVASSSSSNTASQSKIPSSILNSKYNGESLIKYLSDSKNCQSTSSTIKSLAATITKNCKTELEKATAIFNWVRDKISYSFYYNTKKGAVKTLSSKSGNCVDQTHLLIALMRSSGIAAKYVHGKAKFTSGNTYGHVWAQVLIGDTWVVADTTSSRNSLGIVNNWNTKTATIHGTYSSLSF